MSPLLELQGVSYTYPSTPHPAIQNLTLSILAGKKTVILGHNGCGKSTLLLLADGLFPIHTGTIYWKGEPLRYHPSILNLWRQRIGLTFQDPEQQLIAATVAEDISYGLFNLSLPKTEVALRLHQVLIDFSLQDLADRPLHQLSLGQKRRVALAGVIARRPELVLLDEPTAYLDRWQTHHLFKELERIHANGTTLVMATHDIDLAYAWADWVVVLHEGQLMVSQPALQVFSQLEVLKQLRLGVPLILEYWNSLPDEWRKNHLPPRWFDRFSI